MLVSLMVERFTYKEMQFESATGKKKCPICGISSTGRALVLQIKGYWFETCIPH